MNTAEAVFVFKAADKEHPRDGSFAQLGESQRTQVVSSVAKGETVLGRKTPSNVQSLGKLRQKVD